VRNASGPFARTSVVRNASAPFARTSAMQNASAPVAGRAPCRTRTIPWLTRVPCTISPRCTRDGASASSGPRTVVNPSSRFFARACRFLLTPLTGTTRRTRGARVDLRRERARLAAVTSFAKGCRFLARDRERRAQRTPRRRKTRW
jgi:hypothetical protein